MHRSYDNARRSIIQLVGGVRFLLLLILITVVGQLILPGRSAYLHSSSPGPDSSTGELMPALKGDKAVEHLKKQGTYDSLQQAISATRYQANWQPSPKLEGVGGAFEFKNPANNLLAYVAPDGLHAEGLAVGKKSWRLGLMLQGYGYGQALSVVQAGELTAKANRVEIKRSAALTEWFENTSRGIEHGFTLTSPPQAAQGNPQSANEKGPLRLRFAVSGDLQASTDESHDGVAFSREADGVLLSYDKLFVMDAKGRGLNARMKLSTGELVIEVDDAGAEYPLTIDPLLRELTKLTASDGTGLANFGFSVAISGDTVVIGAYHDSFGGGVQHGSAYVFVHSGGGWTEQAKLTASDAATGDNAGWTVAISGNTVVLGAPGDNVGPNDDQGSAYVFERSGITWSQRAKLTAPDGEAQDFFGRSVAVDGDTVVVGALDKIGANFHQGSAYVFVRSGVNWVLHAKLVALDGAADDFFGDSVAVSGNTVVVGAESDKVGANSSQGSAYVFVRNGVIWSQPAKLTASDGAAGDQFGRSVAISGDTIVVGAYTADAPNFLQGAAYVFVRSGVSWTEQAKLTASDGASQDGFGFSVAVSGDTVVVGALFDAVGGHFNQGSSYVYARSGVSWSQQQQLTASDGTASDQFGHSVGISGATIVVGASSDTVGGNSAQGSAYLYVCNWDQQAQLTAGDGAESDNYGNSVAISGDTVVVGARLDDAGFTDQGSAYVYVRSGLTWTEQQQLTAADGAENDFFGGAVAISGDTIVVGADSHQVGDNPAQGSAYVFVRIGTTWSEQQQLFAGDGAAQDQFGFSVAVSGGTVVVGAIGDESFRGSAYVFARLGVTWSEQQQLIASDGAASDNFGSSVAISGDTVVVGASNDDVGLNADQGSAYVFARSGVSWSEQQQLIAGDGAESDAFGSSVGISGDTVVVGASSDDVGDNTDQGSAYVFVRNGASWTAQSSLTAFDGAAGDLFGTSVAVSGDTVVVGAPMYDLIFADQGSAYVFARSGLSWSQQQQLLSIGSFTLDTFGRSVALSGNTVVVGTPLTDAPPFRLDQGSVSVFFMGCNTTPTIDARGGIGRQKGSPPLTATIADVFDGEDPIGYLSVSVASAPAGLLITNIINANGVITATVSASCSAAAGNNLVTLRVQDSDGGALTVGLVIQVTPNTTPTLGAYGNTSVLATGSTTVTPGIPPSDNGAIVWFNATSPTFAGGLSADPESGIITVDDAAPAGTHVVTVTAIDNCGATRSRGFILTVTCAAITVNPSTIPAATAGSFYTQTFTQSGGNGTVGFSLSGTLPTGMTFAGATLSGTPTQVGSFPIGVTATDVNGCSGSRNYTLTINAPMLVWTGNTSSDWQTATNWSPNAVPTSFHDVLIPTAGVGNQPTISSSSSVIHAMTVQTGSTLTINSSRQLTTQGDIASSGHIAGAGTLTFDGATFTQGGSVSVASVEFDSGAHALTGGGSFAFNIITVLNGASVILTSNHSLSVVVINSGGAFDATNQTLALTGAGTPIFNSGSFNATGSTIVYQGGVAQVVTPNIAYNNLTANNAAGLSLAGDTTLNGQLSLLTDITTGAFTLTMAASATSIGSGDVVGNVKRTGFMVGTPLSFGNPFNTIRFDSSALPTDVTMNLVKSKPPGFGANTVSRTYTITPNGSAGYSATLRLRYKDSELNGLDESMLELWRFNGSSWQSPAGSVTRDAMQNWVEEGGITEFSPWAIAGASGPTFIELASFEATAYDDGVFVQWQTGLEVDNLGFNLYREEGGKRSSINSQLLAGSALKIGQGVTLGSGHSYSWWDSGIADCGSRIEDCKNAAYWLEDLDTNGNSVWHGPFYPTQSQDKQRTNSVQQARTLAEFSRNASPSSPIQTRTKLSSSASPLSTESQVQRVIAGLSNSVKLQVTHEAWYRIAARELLSAGLDPSADPRKLQLFVDGKQQAIKVSGEKDGRLDDGDAVEFYGVGIDSPFADARTYYLIAGPQAGLRIATIQSSGHPSPGGAFPITIERRDRTIYFSALRNGDKENFFGAVVASQPVDQSLTLNHLAPSSEPASLRVALQGVTTVSHIVSVQLNGSELGQLAFEGQTEGESTISVPSSMLREGSNQVTLSARGGASDVSLVDFIQLTYQRSFIADDDALKFTANGGEPVTIDGFTTDSIQLFDVTDQFAVQEVSGFIDKQSKPDGQVQFSVSAIAPGKGQRSLLAMTRDNAASDARVTSDYSSNLRSPSQGADLVIVAQRSLFDSLQALKDLRQKEGMAVTIVDIGDIYDEFSFGQKSPQAVKDFLGFARTNWKRPIRYALFFGDASLDPRNYLGLGAFDLVPTRLIDTAFMETASDDWLADFDGDGIADLAIGRLPARDTSEARLMIDKIVSYEQSRPTEEAVLVSDRNDGFNFEASSEHLIPFLPAGSRVTHVRRGELGDQVARAELLDAINRGQRLVNYVGHGSVNLWRGGLMSSSDALQFQNREHLSVFAIMNCLNGYFVDPATESLGEALLRSTGGAVAVWASSAITLPQAQVPMNQEFYRQLFAAHARLGDAALRARAAAFENDARRTWILLGDPTMKVK